MEITKAWTDFKTEVTNRDLFPQWIDDNGSYYIIGKDGFFTVKCELDQDGGADVTEFETDYKDIWNTQIDHHDTNGLVTVHSSPRPSDSMTYFSGAGDGAGIGEGNRMLFNMLASDASKTINLTYSEEVALKDGVIMYENAPLGASLSVEIVHPLAGVVGNYAKKIPLLGIGRVDINSEDAGKVPLGLIVRVVVNNADGTGEQDSAAAFKVCGLLEMYRVTTV